MYNFDEQKQLNSVNGALALRPQIEKIVDEFQGAGFENIFFIGIGEHGLQLFKLKYT